MAKRVSIFWIVIIALLITSLVPLGILAFSVIRSTSRGVEANERQQLSARVNSYGSTIDQQFKAFETATQLTATETNRALTAGITQLTTDDINQRLSKYVRDSRGVFGLDDYYKNTFLKTAGPDHIHDLSDVFVNKNTEITDQIKAEIAVTENLNPLFRAVTDAKLGTQWVYVTMLDGMIRLYPWDGNDSYAADWEPQKDTFFTVADPAHNPLKQPVWTSAYNDQAGAGIMVTNSVPLYDNNGKFFAVVSHDFLIASIQKQVLDLKVGEQGFAFLIDDKGNIVADKDYQIDPHDTSVLGKDLNIKITDKDPLMANVVNAMLTDKSQSSDSGSPNGSPNVPPSGPPSNLTEYVDESGQQWLVAYSTISTTGWHLGIMQPYSEILATATSIEMQIVIGAVILIVVILVMSVLLARWIALPIRKLSSHAIAVASSVDDETNSSFSSASLEAVGGTSEISTLTTAFSEMVIALQRRMSELNSIYAMGQTISANVDFDATMQAVLSAVQGVVDADAAEVSLLEGDRLIIKAWRGKEGFRDTTGRSYHVGEGLTGVIATTKAVNWVGSIEQTELQSTLGYDTAAISELLGKTTKITLKSFLGIPLMRGDQFIGTLSLVHHDIGHFTESDKRQLMKLSTTASIAIENAVKVGERESMLQNHIKELQIEIDEVKKTRQVQEIVESDYFRDIQKKATDMRARKAAHPRSDQS